jgi:hypothetical protein
MQKLTTTDLDAAEMTLGVRLPALYREILVELGLGAFDKREIYHPLAVRDLYEPFFDDPTQLFAPYFPIGCDNRTQELWIIDATTNRAASIWHETVPEDWPDEEWLDFDQWRHKYIAQLSE